MIILLLSVSTILKPGYPELPVIRKLIVGDTSSIRVEIVYEESTAIKTIKPAPYPSPKKGNHVPALKNKDVYSSNEFYPSRPYNIFHLGKKRNTDIYILEIHPVLYNPVRKKIRYSSNIKIEENQAPLIEKQSVSDTVLIVFPEQFYPELKDFIFFKKVVGFEVITLNVENGWSSEQLKNEIRNLNPSYLILIGDTGNLPTFLESTYIPGFGFDNRYTDLPYACQDSNYIPDMYYGRIPAGDTSELENIINKIMDYSFNNGEWKNLGYFIASDDESNHKIAENTQRYSMEVARENNIEVDSHFAYYEEPGTPLKDAFFEGRNLVAYSGHGNTYEWQGPHFDGEDIDSLVENKKTPLIFSFACFTGAFSENDCFMENWLLPKDKGSAFSYGSSTFSFWLEDDLLQRRTMDVIFRKKFIGPAIDTAKLLFARDYSGDTSVIKSYYEQYNPLGDPTMRLRFGFSQKTTIDIPPISAINDTIEAFLNEQGRIGIKQENNEIIVNTSSSGRASIPLTGFNQGKAQVYAVSGEKLPTGKIIHLSPEPIDDIFEVIQNVTTTGFQVNFFAVKGWAEAFLYDVAGRKSKHKRWYIPEDGEYSRGWDISDLPSGVYFLDVQQRGLWNLKEKIIKL